MFEFALAAGQSPADLAEAMGTAELTEEHGDELGPACESFGSVIGALLFDSLLELNAREELQQLREDARKSLHGRTSLVDRLFGENQSIPSQCWPCTTYFLSPQTDRYLSFSKFCFGQEYTGTGHGIFKRALDEKYVVFDYSSLIAGKEGHAHAIFVRDEKEVIFRFW